MKKIYFNTTERGLTISFLKKLLTGQNVKNKSENTTPLRMDGISPYLFYIGITLQHKNI